MFMQITIINHLSLTNNYSSPGSVICKTNIAVPFNHTTLIKSHCTGQVMSVQTLSELIMESGTFNHKVTRLIMYLAKMCGVVCWCCPTHGIHQYNISVNMLKNSVVKIEYFSSWDVKGWRCVMQYFLTLTFNWPISFKLWKVLLTK